MDPYGTLMRLEVEFSAIIRRLSWAVSRPTLVNTRFLEEENFSFILVMEMAVRNHWIFIWIEGDPTSALLAFSKPFMVPIRDGIVGTIASCKVFRWFPLTSTEKV